MLADVACGVGLDEEVEVTRGIIGRYRSIGAHDLFRLSGESSGDGDVLADWETENVG